MRKIQPQRCASNSRPHALSATRIEINNLGQRRTRSVTSTRGRGASNGTVRSTSRTAYPDNGISGSYWYMYAGQVVSHYSVNYYGNGATGGSTTRSDFTPGTAVTLRANGFSRTGHTFASWNTNASGTGTNYAANSSQRFSGDTNLYARWTPITYSITYNANGGTGSVTGQTFTYGSTVTSRNNGYTRPGYTFLGWSTSQTATSAAYLAGSSYTLYGSMTLYAVWR